MNNTELQNKIKNFLLSHGAGGVGFCKADENEFNLDYAVSYTVPLSDAIVDGITDVPTHTYFHHYRSVNALIDHLSLRCGMLIAEYGYKYVPVAASQSINGFRAAYSHKKAAVMAGLGTIGKSDLFISKTYGPRVRLGTILTDCEFDVPCVNPVSECGECMICTNACPAMAIRGKEWSPDCTREDIFDAQACSDHMKRAYQHIGRGAVCGICMKVCPKGRKTRNG